MWPARRAHVTWAQNVRSRLRDSVCIRVSDSQWQKMLCFHRSGLVTLCVASYCALHWAWGAECTCSTAPMNARGLTVIIHDCSLWSSVPLCPLPEIASYVSMSNFSVRSYTMCIYLRAQTGLTTMATDSLVPRPICLGTRLGHRHPQWSWASL